MLKLELLWQLVIVYGIVSTVVYFASTYMIFVPPAATYRDQDYASIIKITSSNNKLISAIYLNNPTAKFTILHSHGNAEDLGHIKPLLDSYYKLGYSVLAYDYQGYGTSAGHYSEHNTYQDITAAYEYLTVNQKIPPQQIIVLGRSLGSGPSIDLAARLPVGGIILESPFITAFRVVTQIPIFIFDRYKNFTKVPNIRCPALIIHGTKDSVIPFWHGKKLATFFNSPTTFLAIDGADHNDLVLFMGSRYWKIIQQFTAKLG